MNPESCSPLSRAVQTKHASSPGWGMVSNQTAMMQSERGDSCAQSPQEGRWDQERLPQGAEPPHCRAPQLGKRTEAQRQGEPPEFIPCPLCPPGAAFSCGSVPDSGALAITSGSWDTTQPTTDPFYSVRGLHPCILSSRRFRNFRLISAQQPLLWFVP